MYRRTLLLAAAAGAAVNSVSAQGPAPVRVFGPGGPGPAMIAAAAAFRAATGMTVEVTAGPTPGWAGRVTAEADIIFSGAEYMMDDFIAQFREALEVGTRTTLYLRPVALLVRKGNPRRITGLRDLLSRPPSEARVLATGGAGQAALWEDVAGRTGDLALLRAMRQRIVLVAPNTGAAQQEWRSKPDAYDAWLVWNRWQIARARARGSRGDRRTFPHLAFDRHRADAARRGPRGSAAFRRLPGQPRGGQGLPQSRLERLVA